MKILLPFFFVLFNHTGVYSQDTLQTTTARWNKLTAKEKGTGYLHFRNVVIPATFIIYGAFKPIVPAIENIDARIMNNLIQQHNSFSTKIDTYLMWTSTASLYAFDAMSIKMKHNVKQHLLIDIGSILITGTLGYGMRKLTSRINAYHTHNTKMPSGHVANAFRGAEILWQELKATMRLPAYSGYLLASAVAVLRVYNRKHLLTEVIAGAGIGLLSSKITYQVFDRFKSRHTKM